MSHKSLRPAFCPGPPWPVAAPMVVPASVLDGAGAHSPSERTFGGGHRHPQPRLRPICADDRHDDVQVLAICDIWKAQAEKVKDFVDNPLREHGLHDVPRHPRVPRERDDIRRGPDRHPGDHCTPRLPIRAMQAGRTSTPEKPSSMTIAEGQAVVEAAKRYGASINGTQRLSAAAPRVLHEKRARGGWDQSTRLTRTSPLGRREDGAKWKPAQEQPPIDEVDWDIWLGPCPWRPVHLEYVKATGGATTTSTRAASASGAPTRSRQAQAGWAWWGDTSRCKYEYVDNDKRDGMVVPLRHPVRR